MFLEPSWKWLRVSITSAERQHISVRSTELCKWTLTVYFTFCLMACWKCVRLWTQASSRIVFICEISIYGGTIQKQTNKQKTGGKKSGRVKHSKEMKSCAVICCEQTCDFWISCVTVSIYGAFIIIQILNSLKVSSQDSVADWR